jgi:hypothetical protein
MLLLKIMNEVFFEIEHMFLVFERVMNIYIRINIMLSAYFLNIT